MLLLRRGLCSAALRVERHSSVGVLTMCRPPHNHLRPDDIHNLADELEKLEKDTTIGCAVLQAEGRSFCAGADFGSAVHTQLDEAILDVYEGAARLFDCQLPIVGAVQGPAVGGGLGLSMVADIRIASADARFCANFAALGIHQGFGLSATLPPLLGPSRAARVLYSARRFTADEALALGLCDEVVADAEALRARALALAGEIAANAPLALRAIKSTLRHRLGDAVREVTRREARLQTELLATEDAREGQAAMRERRAGVFRGR